MGFIGIQNDDIGNDIIFILYRHKIDIVDLMVQVELSAGPHACVILRIGYLCRAGYEWGQHVLIALDCGLTRDEIECIKIGADAGDWNALDQALLRATDELHADAFISDTSWAALSEHLDEQQILDVIFAVGNYNLVSMVLNSAGVQLDPGIAGFETDEKAE